MKKNALFLMMTLAFMPFSTLKAEKPALEINDIILGSDKAPVTVTEYSSINCPVCANFHGKAFKKFKERFLDTNKVKLIFKHFPLDYNAVVYMSLIAKQPEDKWLGLLDIAYDRQQEWIGQEPEKLAKILGISAKDCQTAQSCEQTKERIMAKRFNAEKTIKIEATPTFEIFYKVKGQEKSLLINEGITPENLLKKLDEILEIADGF